MIVCADCRKEIKPNERHEAKGLLYCLDCVTSYKGIALTMPPVSSEDMARSNDLFRSTMIQDRRHSVVLTSGVSALPYSDRDRLLELVRSFNVFTPDNDPWLEHDFGKVTLDGIDYFWKIDYYDDAYEFGKDPKEGPCARLLTIMRADEY